MHSPQAEAKRAPFLALMLTIIATLSGLTSRQARADDGDSLPQLRKTYLQAVATATLEKEIEFAARLPELERRLRERKDYLAARAVAQERGHATSRITALELLAGEQQPPPENRQSRSTDPDAAAIVLKAETAIVRDPVHFDPELHVITGLQNAGNECSWQLAEPLLPGGYEVFLTHLPEERCGGNLRIEAGFHRLTCTIVSSGATGATGATGELQRVAVGTIRITEETSNIVIVAETVPYETLTRIHCMELRPALP